MVHLVLEDGRGLWRSTVVMSGVYHLIAASVDGSQARFKRWLEDMSNRPVPFMDFDLRGLSQQDRDEFHRAARVTRDKLLIAVTEGRIAADATEPYETLVRMKERMDRAEHPLLLSDDKEVLAFDGLPCDLDQIWEDNGGSAVA